MRRILSLLLLLACALEAYAQDDAGFAAKREACLKDYKERVRQLYFEPQAGTDPDLNAAIQKMASQFPKWPERQNLKKLFSWTLPKGSDSVTEMEVKGLNRTGDRTLNYEITLTQEPSSDSFFSLRIRMAAGNGRSKTFLRQYLFVDQDCHDHVTATNISEERVEGRKLTFSRQVFGAPGEPAGVKATKTIALPAGIPVLLDLPEIWNVKEAREFLARFGNREFLLAESIEVPTLRVKPRPIQEAHFDRLRLSSAVFSGAEASFDAPGVSINSSVLFSPISEFAISTDADSEYWYLSEDAWQLGDIVRLSHTTEPIKERFSLYSMTLEPSSLMFEASMPLPLPSLRTYWDLPAEPEAANGSYDYTLNAKPIINYAKLKSAGPSLKAGSQPSGYLGDSDYVKTGLPEIQALAREARTKAGPRVNAIKVGLAVAWVITKHYHYDNSRLNINGHIQDMPTDQLVRLDSGTCQNRANLFTAVARALGLPARIISGLYVSANDLTNHAWVEFFDGALGWLPLDLEDARQAFQPVHYIPMAIEEKDTYMAPEVQETMRQRYFIKVLSTRPAQLNL
jgi:hypothetical protein